jgi:hypothetical protein
MAGFELPVGGTERRSALLALPDERATAGVRVTSGQQTDGATEVVTSAGRGTLGLSGLADAVGPGAGEEQVVLRVEPLEVTLAATARLTDGALVERSWTATCEPAGTGARLPYGQRGAIRRLGDGERPVLEASREIDLPGSAPAPPRTTLALGADPR